MKSPKMTVVALLSALTVSSVFAGDEGLPGGFTQLLGSTSNQPKVDSTYWETAKGAFGDFTNYISEKASQNPKTTASLTGFGAGVAGAGAVHGLYKAGQYGVNTFQNWRNKDATTETTTEDKKEEDSFFKRNQKKLAAAGLGVVGVAGSLAAKYYGGVDFTAQPGALLNGAKAVGNYALNKAQGAGNYALNNKMLLGMGVTGVGAYGLSAAYVASGDEELSDEELDTFRKEVTKLLFKHPEIANFILESEEATEQLEKLDGKHLSLEDREKITGFLDQLVADFDRQAKAAEDKRKADAAKALDDQRKALAKAAEDKRKADAKAAEDKRKADAKAAEDKRKAGAAELKRKADAKAAEDKRKAEQPVKQYSGVAEIRIIRHKIINRKSVSTEELATLKASTHKWAKNALYHYNRIAAKAA